MSFASPLWLLGLLPWATVVLWLLMGRRERARVPFVELWRGPVKSPKVRPKLETPPAAMLCAIAAVLLAILGAARPRMSAASNAGIQHPTTQPVQKVTITRLAARASPVPQVMVRLRNDSDLATAQMSVGGQPREIQLPPRGQEKSYFIDLTQAESSIEVDVQGGHGILTRRQAWPIIEPIGELPPEVRRMIQTYSKVRPPGDASAHVIVTSEPVSNDRPALIVAPPDAPLRAGRIQVEDHSVSAHVDWSSLTANGTVAEAPPNFRALVAVGGHPLVAVRDAPARQVWIGFTSDSWPRSADFVMFYTNALDWAGQGQDVYDAKLAPATAPASEEVVAHNRPHLPLDLTASALVLALTLVLIGVILWSAKAHGGAVGSQG